MKYLSDYMDDRRSEVFKKYGVFFAFSQKQFDETKKPNIEYVSMGAGMIAPEKYVKVIIEELDTIHKESIKQDIEENGIPDIIQRELANHEFCITGEIDDTVNALDGYGITEKQIQSEIPRYYKLNKENI